MVDNVPLVRFNEFYEFAIAYSNINECKEEIDLRDPAKIVLSVKHVRWILTFQYFSAQDLRHVLMLHGIWRVPVREGIKDLRALLGRHICTETCLQVVYVFKIRTDARRGVIGKMLSAIFSCSDSATESVDRQQITHETNVVTGGQVQAPASTDADTTHFDIADDKLKSSIIAEWQQEMSTQSQKYLVCAVCARRRLHGDISHISSAMVPLEILRNDELPVAALPSTYNFETYKRALLHPAGMLNLSMLGIIRVCTQCEKSLCQGRTMPKFALANWLYSGYDELPPEIKKDFNDATSFELRLIARARASRICVRFTELPGKDVRDTRSAIAQRFSRGNVMILPQDVAQLNDVIPASTESLWDTMSVLFVTNRKVEKLKLERLYPVLVRKSRVSRLARFLTRRNTHYRLEEGFQGFSQENLDLIHGPDKAEVDDGIPACVEIGQFVMNEATEGATSDYTFRNIVDGESDLERGLLMENVGFTSGDNTTVSYNHMKMRAVQHCLEGGKFIRSIAGSQMIPDFENTRLLAWLFPHLDPWGIMGFHHPLRAKKLSMREQVEYFLAVEDSRFEADADFAFVYFNILQKKSVYENVQFSVPYYQHQQIVDQLMAIDQKQLLELQKRFARDPSYRPQSSTEKAILLVLAKVGLVTYKIPGTTAYKLAMRNEIRAMINYKGTPTLFITLNPADTHNPLVRLLSGEDIVLEDVTRGEDLDDWGRKLVVAKNPRACAIFFHIMMKKFISVILRHGRNGRGLFGVCNGYYGTVEAQGRGTLHCHMLIWLDGHLSPQRLRDTMEGSDVYRDRMFQWLESIIHCELMDSKEMIIEPPGVTLQKPNRSEETGDPHPGVVASPSIIALGEDEFHNEYIAMVNSLVKEYNWHVHSATCWKYLKSSQPHNDAHCRMRMDGKTRAVTSIDPETRSILLRRLHPRIAPYNDVVTFLMKCNTDVKFIGSGEAAKALVYYVTDYITKASLQTHVGLAALSYAIEKANSKYPEMQQGDRTKGYRGSLTITVNSMMSRQEISHQQVMSYLSGGGDHYTSDRFQVLYWNSFSRYVDTVVGETLSQRVKQTGNDNAEGGVESGGEPATQRTGRSDASREIEKEDPEKLAFLRLGSGSISASNQRDDYVYRSGEPVFAKLCLYDFVSRTRKIAQKKPDMNSTGGVGGGERSDLVGGEFLEGHPQRDTHRLKVRRTVVIPVIIGERIARPDRSEVERERWARAILTLFRPWRLPTELKQDCISWTEAYDDFKDNLSVEHSKIISNINVLSECRDARDDNARVHSEQRMQVSDEDLELPVTDILERMISEAAEIEENVYGVFQEANEHNRNSDLQKKFADSLDHVVGVDCRRMLQSCMDITRQGCSETKVDGYMMEMTSEGVAQVEGHTKFMDALKRKRRPEYEATEGCQTKRYREHVRHPETAIVTLDEISRRDTTRVETSRSSQEEIVEEVIHERSLASNDEQLRAFRIVANHVMYGQQQLLMYMAGMGGTGKSHVILSIVRLFEVLGLRRQLLIGAPTGIASVLIGGHTVHALTMLPEPKRSDFTELRSIWRDVQYLVIDEVSMVSAQFLSQISDRLKQAKGEDHRVANLPFGGVNIIFTGDFGQLKPVRQDALYAFNLVKRPSFAECRDGDGVNSLNGAFLWRQVNTVVVLKVNVRQKDDGVYAEFLKRLRTGSCWNGLQGDSADIRMLRGRDLGMLMRENPEQASKFLDAPVIVGTRKVRDTLNSILIDRHARKLDQSVHLYHSKDFIRREHVPETLREHLWGVASSKTEDALGKLPLFPGMKVMVTTNLAMTRGVVNGAEGIVQDVMYSSDDVGRRYASVAYVRIKKSGLFGEGLKEDVVPILPERVYFEYRYTTLVGQEKRRVSRMQLPLVPAYAYTDYKSQGRSLDCVVVDPASARTLQGVYVMLSRVKSLNGLAILRWFPEGKVYQRMSEEMREEFSRIEVLHDITKKVYEEAISSPFYPASVSSFSAACSAASGRYQGTEQV